jgi:hypothetical protein
MEITTKDFEIYPNPSSQNATLKFLSKSDGRILIEVYQLNGSRSDVLFDQFVTANTEHSLEIASSTWSPGVYFLSMTAEDKTSIQKFFVIKKQ